ncbi:MAG TPA: malto-oligosyltrehalose synthase [Mycobacteriales bacterium]|nr:malto-oligosyltrehalose synthase [Mycobacteriales bacterium]
MTTTPASTYRLQLRREFGFRHAAAVVPYLADLGVSHVYCSPVLAAVPGSAHGYDVVDPTRLSPELGGDEGWRELVAACRSHGVGLVVDVVPNHMAVPTPESLNGALWDVLRLGRASAYAVWFDIDWDAEDGRILLPVLGQPVQDCLAAGELRREGDVVRYFDHEFPLAPDRGPTGDDDLAALLDRQHYRLAHWHEANSRLNYRRFFDVTSLIGVRVELPEVFTATHRRVLELVRAGEVDGLRIDHPDGLADPGGYLDRLAAASGDTWTVVEKILEAGEELPASWRCAGTTGYDALRTITQLLLDPAGLPPLTRTYAELTGAETDVERVVEQSKRLVVTTLFDAEVSRLQRELGATDADTRAALVELLVAFDVYRAYPGDPGSKQRLAAATERAAHRAPQHAATIEHVAAVLRDEPRSAFAIRFAQTTGPVMAKGVEDTAFYRYHRLVALNEVGGEPDGAALTPAQWHAQCADRADRQPAAMTTLTTHDTKRSEDVRARLLVLAELPDEWRTAVERWRAVAAAAGHQPPDRHVDYLFWQTLVGAWPIEEQRVQDYLLKAVREAKLHTSWIDGDAGYEQRLHDFVGAVFADRALLDEVAAWVARYLDAPAGSNMLGQKLLQLTMPGVPDVYQGQELPGYFLVDPDNRQPVDYDLRRNALAGLDDPKLLVTATALRLRRERPQTFAGGYTPVEVTGAAAEHAVAFCRGDDVITVVTRLPVGLHRRDGWADTTLRLPVGRWEDRLTGRPARPDLGGLLDRLPVALLVRTDG